MMDTAVEACGAVASGVAAAALPLHRWGWPGTAAPQSTRAWAATCRPADAPPPTPLATPAAPALSVAAAAPRCSSSDSARRITATSSLPPQDWTVWTYLPPPDAASASAADGHGRGCLTKRPGGRAWASAASAAGHGLPPASAAVAWGRGGESGRPGSGGSECGGSGSSCSSCYSRCGGGSSSGRLRMVGGGRAMLLASLTTSSASSASRSSSAVATPDAAPPPAVAGAPPAGAAAAAAAGAAAAGGGLGPGAGLFRGFNLPQISLMPPGRLPAASASAAAFAADQELAAELHDYHTAKHGGFPRACPRCKSNSFFERGPAPAASAGAASGAAARGVTAAAASPMSAGGGGEGGGGEVVAWRSRPLCCDMCGAWVHLGCARVDLLEQVPPRPWFHTPECRNNYIRLEAAAEQNPHASSHSPSSQLYILTPADHAAYGAMAARAAGGGGGGGGGGMPGRPRGPAGSVVPLLSQGFNADAIEGFGEPAREYDGGRYAAVLVAARQPVAAAAFNVWGADAQLCMLATATAARRRGHGAALVADLEGLLKRLGVRRLVVQARRVALPMWLGPRFGYSLVAPEAAEQLHAQLPVAYYDCALLEKWL